MNDSDRQATFQESTAKRQFSGDTAEPSGMRLTSEEQKALDELVLLGKNSAVTSAAAAAIDLQDAKALPRLYIDLPGVLVLCLAAQILLGRTLPGLSHDLWVHLPMQIYWTFCLYRLSQVMARKYKDNPPLGELELSLLTLVSFVFMPSFSLYHFAPRFLDPFFLCWAASQFWWTARMGFYLERKENPSASMHWRLPLALAAGTNAYILFGLFYPPVISTPVFFNALWFVCQFWCILFLTLKLKGKFDETAAKTGAESKLVLPGGDVVIRYRPFIAVERWFKERLSGQGMKKGARFVLMWFVGPVMLIASLAVLMFLAGNIDSAVHQDGPLPSAVAIASVKMANQSFITFFFSILAGLTGLGAVIYLWQPTHLALGTRGLRFLWRHNHFFWLSGAYIPWSDLVRIAIVRPSGKTSPLDDRLCFAGQNNKRFALKMGSIEAVEDRESLLKAIRKWAPNVSRDASVEQALQPPPDYSYTELWLQALSAPPKRERLQPLLPGVCLRNNRYKVVQTLGAGGQGQAYLAKDTLNEQNVVLKEFILPVYVDVNVRRTALEQFENEARILSQLDHPQIVKMLDFFIEDHRAYLVLELITGASLHDIVKDRGRLPEKQVRMLASQMCDILSYLHSLSPPVVHRDFTPDNLILNVDGVLKLIDFNVAKQEVESTTTGTVVGKHAYLPPEQFRGMPVTQSDIYALGATLYFLLTGQDPEPIAVSHPQRLVDEVSDALNAVVEHATALDLASRYQSINELRAAMIV